VLTTADPSPYAEYASAVRVHLRPVRVRELVEHPAVAAVRPGLGDGDDAVRVRIRKWPQHERVHEREHDRVGRRRDFLSAVEPVQIHFATSQE
jgi:hypothetical protein